METDRKGEMADDDSQEVGHFNNPVLVLQYIYIPSYVNKSVRAVEGLFFLLMGRNCRTVASPKLGQTRQHSTKTHPLDTV